MPRILAVDDEPHVLSMEQLVLELEGYEVITASDGDTALRLVAELQPDLVLLDVMMPGLSGFDVARALREDTATAELPIVFASAKAEATDQWQGWQLGAASYVTKPFDTDLLVDEVARALARRPAAARGVVA